MTGDDMTGVDETGIDAGAGDAGDLASSGSASFMMSGE
jgi:hypothetical protein